MERHGEEVDVTEEEASAGEKSNIVRYVLVISLFLAIAAMTIVWVTGAVTSDAANERPGEQTQQTG